MARGSERKGFNIDNIVATTSNSNKTTASKNSKPVVTNKTDVSSEVQDAKSNTDSKLEDLIKKPEKKIGKMIYLSHSQSKELEAWGKKVGKVNGGASRIVSEALKEYFTNHEM